ncbi:MAG: TolC family outer membrane protein [Burkholderiales bacterium]
MKRLCVLLLLLVSVPGWAEDLMSLYRTAQIQDAVYAGAKAQYLAAQEKMAQARAGLLPSVNFEAGANYLTIDSDYDSQTFPSGSRDFYDYNLGVKVTQPLYRKVNSLNQDQAKISVRQAENQLSVAAQDLMTRVAQGYFDVLLARNNLDTVGAQKRAVAEQLEQAKRNFIVGTATITDSREAQARFDLVVAQELVAQNDLEVKLRSLEQIVGKPVSEPVGLRLPISLSPPTPANMEAWVEQAYQSSLQVALAQQNLELSTQELKKADAGHGPTLDAVGSLNHTYASSSAQGIGSEIQSLVVGVRLNIPLYEGGAVNSRVREAAANQERARQDLVNVRRSVALATRQAYLGVTSGLAQVVAFEQAVASTRLQRESTKLGQEVGVRTAVDVLNADQQLAEAQRNLAQSLYGSIVNQLKLKAAVGKLAESDLADVNRLLKADPQ